MKQFLTLIDAHVHIYKNFNLENFIKAAFTNFKLNSEEISPGSEYVGILCLTESNGYNYFENFNDTLKSLKYKSSKTSEKNSLICFDSNNRKIYFIAGRQIVTSEKLEVLALGLRDSYPDGNPIGKVINFVISKNCLPIIPWGAGKWIGKRRNIVENVVKQDFKTLFLGDNGNRPFFWGKSKIFYHAEERGVINLPGSDPLPFDSEEKRAGGFGFYFNEKLDEQNPFENLKERIISRKNSFDTYGKLETPIKFLKNQVSMQMKKNKMSK